MRNRRVVFSRMLALVLPAALGLSCIERDWSVCSPQDQCQTGYTCTTDWKCVRAVDGGSDGPVAVDSQAADTPSAAMDGPVSERDAPADLATPDAAVPDAFAPDAPAPDAATPDTATPDAAAGTGAPDAANLDSAMHDAASPDTAAPDAAADTAAPDAAAASPAPDAATPDIAMPDAATPDVSGADAAPTCPAGKRDCNGTCIDQTGCCQASDCTGSCKTCTSHACVAVIGQDSPTCAGTCDSTGTCTSKKGQLCTAVPGGCAAGTRCSPEGICCDRACSGSCEACNLPSSVGTCTTLPSGDTPHSGHTACGGTGVCAGSCGGSIDGSCTYPTVVCGSASCTGLTYQAAGACNGGTCATPAAQTCLYACSTTAGCTGECSPTSTRCNAGTAQICSASSTWQDITPNPCQNGGSCVSGTSGYTCSCTGGWADANCTAMFKYLPLPTGCTAGHASATGISGDGNSVVGTAYCAGYDRAWRWTASGGTQTLHTASDNSEASGTNYDGTMISGNDGGSPAKWTWNSILGQFDQTLLPNHADSSMGDTSQANGVSSYGTVVGTDAGTAVRWTGGAPENLFDPLLWMSYASAISRYDEAIAGTYDNGIVHHGFRRTASGSVTNLDCVSGNPIVLGISTDGKIVVGACGTEATRWDETGSRTSLGFQGEAYAANQDGTVIVGGEGSLSQVFVWIASKGASNLGTVLASVPGIPSGADAVKVPGISSDGRIIAGSNNPASGTGEKAWIAYLP